MSTINIEGGTPLIGTVNISGSTNSAIKLIYAAMFSNEDVILDNVPKVGMVENDLEVVRSVGAKAEWVSGGRLLLNGSGIDSYKISPELGSKYRTSYLFAGALLYRFGKAQFPKINEETLKYGSVNRFFETWKSLGITIEEDKDFYLLTAENLTGGHVSFKNPTHLGTDNAILSSLFMSGETIISNASQEPEIDDHISFLKTIGANVERIEPTKIKVVGSNIFKGGSFRVCTDKVEAVFFAAAALLTGGNILIKGAEKESLAAFINYLLKIGARFEFSGSELKVWKTDEELNAEKITIAPYPGLIPEWQSILTLVATKSNGESLIHDTVYPDRFEYVQDLNRMGAHIELVKPSEAGLSSVVSSDVYDEKQGEPATIAKVLGPVKLKATRLNIETARYGPVLVLAALIAEGKSEIFDSEKVENGFENFYEKLKNLGAKIN